MVVKENGKGIGALDPGQRLGDCLERITLIQRGDQMGSYFGIGLGYKVIALGKSSSLSSR